jgi:hypothetical protein
MFNAFAIREALEMLERRKLSMITGLWANDGLNQHEGKNPRADALKELEDQHENAVALILYGGAEEEDNTLTEDDWNDPFLRPAIEATRRIEAPRDDEGSVQDALKSEGYEIDQD